jgi:Protein of unknown function (DUF3168)
MSVDSQWALQQAVYQALVGDLVLQAWLGTPPRVYDQVPGDAAYPYVVIGEISGRPFDSKTSQGMSLTLTLHVWDGADQASGAAAPGYRGAGRLRQIMARLLALLDRAALDVVGHALVQLRFERSESLPDADGLLRHGQQRFTALIESA